MSLPGGDFAYRLKVKAADPAGLADFCSAASSRSRRDPHPGSDLALGQKESTLLPLIPRQVEPGNRSSSCLLPPDLEPEHHSPVRIEELPVGCAETLWYVSRITARGSSRPKLAVRSGVPAEDRSSRSA